MKGLILIFVSVSILGCQRQPDKDITTKVDSVEYPLLIDSGKKMVLKQGRMTADKGWVVCFDTITFTKGQLYRKDSIRHPLHQFGLSYPEWETIRCIIAVDERDYWDKSMIGLIEKSGTLRIHYHGQKIRLSPIKTAKANDGEWRTSFKNDSLEIQILGNLENKRILGSLRGYGNLALKTPNQTIKETIYLVYKNNK